MNIDIRKKLIDKSNEIVNEAIQKTPEYKEIPMLDSFLKDLVALSMEKGFMYGVSTVKQTTEFLLKDLTET